MQRNGAESSSKASGTPRFQLQQRVMAKRNGVYRSAIIEQIDYGDDAENISGSPSSRQVNSGSSGPINMSAWRFYVHWPDADRRMDAWVTADMLRAGGGAITKTPKQLNVVDNNMKLRPRRTQDIVEPSKAIEAPPKVYPPKTQTTNNRSQESKFFCRGKNISRLYMGKYEMEMWYYTPIRLAQPVIRAALAECGRYCAVSPTSEIRVTSSPARAESATPSSMMNGDMSGGWGSRSSEFGLHVCPFCLSPHLDHETLMNYHMPFCPRRPPGTEVYRDTQAQMVIFEADGCTEKVFAERLGLLSKGFLEHKSLDFDTTPFVYYTLCFYDEHGCHVAAYFSREKRNPENFNLSCILVFPHFQSRGLGRFLVDMSYEMCKREGRRGSPEKPLSDLGERTYHSYWKDSVVSALIAHGFLEEWPTTLEYIMRATGMTQLDVVATLKQLKMLDTKSNVINLHVTPELLASHNEKKLKRLERGEIQFEPTMLCWAPWQYCLVERPRTALKISAYPHPGVNLLIAALESRSSTRDDNQQQQLDQRKRKRD